MAFQVGYRIIGTILEVKGTCHAGHKVGDEIELSGHQCGGLCGFFYHDIFPYIIMLQFGGSFPKEWKWASKDILRRECPDRANAVKIELRRVGEFQAPSDEA